jgi:hypothetical protein
MILDGLKKRLYDEKSQKGGKWINELPHVVWGLWTQPSKATGHTPFFLIYRSEAILPADIMWTSPRVEMYDEGEAEEARQLELDSVQEANAMLPLSSWLITSKESDATTIAMSRRGCSTSLTWSSIAFRTRQSCKSSTRDGKGFSSYQELQGQDHINYSTLMAKRSQTPRTYIIYGSCIFSTICT